MDSSRRIDWKIRLEANINGLIWQDKQPGALFSRQREAIGGFLKSLLDLPLEGKLSDDIVDWTE